MQSILLRILFCALMSPAFGQSSTAADDLFNNFEFSKAITAYKALGNPTSELDQEEKERLGYCYYITGNFTEGLSYLESVMLADEKRAHMWLWKGTLQKEAGKYNEAKKSFESFKANSTELSQEIDLLIESCESLDAWEPLTKHTASASAMNTSFSTSYSKFQDQTILLYEIGLNKEGKLQSVADSDTLFSEALLMRPVSMNNGKLQELALFDNFQDLSINRIQLVKGTNQLVFSASKPLSDDLILQAPQIYFANYTSLDEAIEEIQIWEYSGELDSSSCSHMTLSDDGKTMVFAKSSKSTNRSDLYRSSFANNVWSAPVEMNALNTFGDEMFPQFQGDSLLTFSTDGRVGYGGLDIYAVEVKNGAIGSDLKHYLAPINSSMDDFNFSWQDSLNATVVSNRFGGNGDDDIWNIVREKEIVDTVIIIPPDGFEEWYDTWNMKQIYFDFDSFEAEVNADFIAGCKRYAEKYGLDVTLVGHTDSRGISAYNYNLGLDRSQWMKEQLVSAKVFNKISTESVGETELVNDCHSGLYCSEEDHRLNRFVQIKLTVAEATQK